MQEKEQKGTAETWDEKPPKNHQARRNEIEADRQARNNMEEDETGQPPRIAIEGEEDTAKYRRMR